MLTSLYGQEGHAFINQLNAEVYENYGKFYKIHNQTLHIIIVLPPNLELIVLKNLLIYFLSMTNCN